MWKLNNTLTYNTWSKEEMIKGSLYFELKEREKILKFRPLNLPPPK